ncbi:MAG: CobW family GTP-binding protein [Thomasclavelia sp.]|uniref:CobW family GTP-binding protein n=1 Tax=Thomasclavelia sp. TaxID=3025757 RepID=UPI0039A34A7F
MIKVDIISGFLGAGKTTFIKKLIKEVYPDEQIVLIENEFGEIGIDGTFMHDSGIEVTEINSGCICCSLVGDFETSLVEVIEKYHPDRIIIEPSGVGKLSDVIKAVNEVHSDKLLLENHITVIDAKKCRLYTKNFGEFFNNQIKYASLIILSRTEDITELQLDECIKIIKEHNNKANIITTTWSQLNQKTLIDAFDHSDNLRDQLFNELDICPECGHHHEHHHDHECEHEHHHADEIFTSWGIQTPKKYTKIQLETILKKLSENSSYGNILRAKGYLDNIEGDWWYFDLVPGEYEIRTGKADFTGRICVIGENLNEKKLDNLFNEVA